MIFPKLKLTIKHYLKEVWKGIPFIPIYYPGKLKKPGKILNLNEKSSGWKGIELIIDDILNRYKINRESCIEFGVESGYSTVVLSNFFKRVIGIDTFEGDMHAGKHLDNFAETKLRLSEFENIKLYKSDYKDWISNDENYYDLAHVDIIHTYKDTYACGLWAVQHTKCAIFHDTESFMEVRNAVIDIARATGKRIYNYPYSNGLSIIIDKKKF